MLEDAIDSVEDKNGYVAAVNGVAGASPTEVLEAVLDATFLATAGGVNQETGLLAAVCLDGEGDINSVARGARDVADDYAVALGECIDE